MGVNTTQATYLILGGGFIGYWLFVLLFPDTGLYGDMSVAGWVLWGVLGMALAVGLFAGRITDGTIRNLLWIGTGIAGGLAIGAAIYQETANIIATIITGVGAGLIGAGLFFEDTQLWNLRRPASAPAAAESQAAPREWIATQEQGGQQQSVHVSRQPYR